MGRSVELGHRYKRKVPTIKRTYEEAALRPLLNAIRETRIRLRQYFHGELTRRMPPYMKSVLEIQVDALNLLLDNGG